MPPAVSSVNGKSASFLENNAGILDSDNDFTFVMTNTAVLGNGTNTAVAPDDATVCLSGSARVLPSLLGGRSAELPVRKRQHRLRDAVVHGHAEARPSSASTPTTTGRTRRPSATTPSSACPPFPEQRRGPNRRDPGFGATYSNSDGFKSPAALFDSPTRLAETLSGWQRTSCLAVLAVLVPSHSPGRRTSPRTTPTPFS